MSTSGQPGVAKPNKLAFLVSSKSQQQKEKEKEEEREQVVVSLWRCVCEEGKKPVTASSALSALQAASQNQKWVILLCSGGRYSF